MPRPRRPAGADHDDVVIHAAMLAVAAAICSVVARVLTGKQHVLEPEAAHVAHAHGIEDAVEVIDFVLYDARMEAIHGAIDGLAEVVEAAIPESRMPGHDAAHTGHRQASFPAFLFLAASGVSTGFTTTV